MCTFGQFAITDKSFIFYAMKIEQIGRGKLKFPISPIFPLLESWIERQHAVLQQSRHLSSDMSVFNIHIHGW